MFLYKSCLLSTRFPTTR